MQRSVRPLITGMLAVAGELLHVALRVGAHHQAMHKPGIARGPCRQSARCGQVEVVLVQEQGMPAELMDATSKETRVRVLALEKINAQVCCASNGGFRPRSA